MERRAILRAVTDPLGLVLLGSGGMAAAAFQSVPALAVGALAWATVSAWELLAKRESKPEVPRPPELPPVMSFGDAAVREAIGGLHRARAELDRVLAATPGSIAGHLGGALAGVRELEGNAVELAGRADRLADYLKSQDRVAITADATRLEKLAAQTRDPSARGEFTRALAARGDQLRTLDEIQSARDRAIASLSRVTATLEGLAPRVVHMRALDEVALDTVGQDVERDLAELGQDLRLLEETLQSLGQTQ